MHNPIEKQVEELLVTGLSRKAVYARLKKGSDINNLLFFLNNSALPNDRRRFQLVNLVLVLLLTFVTAKKLITIFSFGMMDFALLLSLVVPIVNIYVLREVLRFHRLGYQFLLIISVLSLVQPENHQPHDLLLFTVMIALAAFLRLKMFPAASLVAQANPTTAGKESP